MNGTLLLIAWKNTGKTIQNRSYAARSGCLNGPARGKNGGSAAAVVRIRNDLPSLWEGIKGRVEREETDVLPS
jgi:hypothetical protein